MPLPTPPTLILGGGITGLAAAWQLQQLSLPYILLESSPRLGGKLKTLRRPDGYTLELGADAILRRKPWAYDLALELGLADRILHVNKVESGGAGTYVLHKGRPIPLPEGLQLLVPSKWGPFLKSPLFTPWGKARAALDLVLPRRTSDEDESLAAFITRRLGKEFLTKVADPMLAGVYNGESSRQSILATFPQFPALEKQYGSLIKGIRAKQAAPATETPPFFSFKSGLQELPEALASQLTGPIHLSTQATSLTPAPNNTYHLTTSTGQTFTASNILLTTPVHITAALLTSAAPEAAALLSAFRYTGIGSAYLAYPRSAVPHPLNGYGVVIPRNEHRLIDGMMWSSSKWQGRAPENHALIRLFFGGPHTREVLTWPDDQILQMCQEELRTSLGITAKPLFTELARWTESEGAYPQYDTGHLQRVAQLQSTLPPGLTLAGCAYKGVGIPDCIHQGREAAKSLALRASNS